MTTTDAGADRSEPTRRLPDDTAGRTEATRTDDTRIDNTRTDNPRTGARTTDRPAEDSTERTRTLRRTEDRPAVPAHGTAAATTAADPTLNPEHRRTVVDRQKAAFGGMKFGSDFFGWLTASGTAVLLVALVAGLGAAIGLSKGNGLPTMQDAASVGIGGGIALLVVTFIAYFAGGYVAGRMARFNGLVQGFGVWLWAVIVAVVVAVLGLIAGARFDLLARVNSFPRIPLNEGTLTTAGIITAVAVAVVSLVGALLGGLTGMRFHRRVDRAGFEPTAEELAERP